MCTCAHHAQCRVHDTKQAPQRRFLGVYKTVHNPPLPALQRIIPKQSVTLYFAHLSSALGQTFTDDAVLVAVESVDIHVFAERLAPVIDTLCFRLGLEVRTVVVCLLRIAECVDINDIALWIALDFRR